MDRREFLIRCARGGSVLLILPAGWVAGGCGSSSSYGTQTPSGTAAAGTTDLRFTSDVVGGHSPDFNIAMTDLSSPRSAGLSGSTTVSLGHTHTVSLSMAELMQIESGQTVTKDTSSVQAHMHTFQFSLAAAASTSGGTASTGAGGSGAGGTTGTGGGTTGPGHYP